MNRFGMFSKFSWHRSIYFNGLFLLQTQYQIFRLYQVNNQFHMLKTLNISEDQLSIQQRLLYLCKKSAPGAELGPEIDFLILDREMQQLQQLQSKTCQQIVEFVDEHLQKFIVISTKFKQIEENVEDSQMLIKKIIPKLDMYKTNVFSPETKIQQFVSSYQKKLIQAQLSSIAKQQTEFLLSFIREFEIFININVEELNKKYKFQIVRLLKKKQYIKWIFEHPLINNATHNSNDLSILLANINEQLEFYLSEQLSRVAASQQLKSFKVQTGFSLVEQLEVWYKYMGKQEGFFQIIQESIIGRKLPSLQQLLLNHKQALVVGNQQNIVKQFFSQLFSLVQQFPIDYPKERILKIIYKFLGKKQLNFIYSYVVPTFPISYLAYREALTHLKNQQVKAELQIKHGWNLKFWADLRIKSIMDRSGKDKQKPLNKWIQIVFKKNFMIHGVKNYMIKLAFLLINRYCSKFEQQIQFTSKALNQNFTQLNLVTETIKKKLQEAYEQEFNDQKQPKKQIQNKINKVVHSIHDQIGQAMRKWIISNMQMIINSCRGSLEPYKSFVLSIISKKDRQKGMNNQENILKPLRAYLKNNPQIQEECSRFIQKIILGQVESYYDSEYVKQIYNHCHSNISTDQMRVVMEIVSVERQNLFELNRQKNERTTEKN